MKFNICIIKPDKFVHADAFWELAQLLAYSLRDLEYKTNININELDQNAHNIIFGSHLLPEDEFGSITSKKITNPTIIFNTEQLYLEENRCTKTLFSLHKDFKIWDYNVKNIERLNKEGFKKTSLFEIGFHKKLERIEKHKIKDIDVLLYGSMNERRIKIVNDLREKNLNTKVLYGVYGSQRDEYISRSKIVLNLHYFDSQIFEVVRVHYLVNNKVPVVCEINTSTQIDPWWRETILGVEYANLVEQCAMLVGNTKKMESISSSAFLRLKERKQAKIVSDLLSH